MSLSFPKRALWLLGLTIGGFANTYLLLAETPSDSPTIASVSPPPGTVTSLTQLTINFSRPVTDLDADDLLVNGQPAIKVTGLDTSFTFVFTPPAAGPVEIQWDASHGITDRDTPSNRFDATQPNASWRYELLDRESPVIASLVPAPGATIRQLRRVEVQFTEPVTGIDAGDLLMNERPSLRVAGEGAGPYVFEFAGHITGTLQMAWRSPHGIADLANPANAFSGGGWHYTIDESPSAIVINELLAANQNGLRDEDNEPQDWIELLNRGDKTINLAGWSLTDGRDSPGKWTLPPVSLAPGQFLVIFASGKDRRDPSSGKRLHTNFKLSAAGEYLGLFNAESPRWPEAEFAPQFPVQRTDIAYGLASNGQWSYFPAPTPGAANPSIQSYEGVVVTPKASAGSGLFAQPFDLTLTTATPGAVIYFTLDGSEPTPLNAQTYSTPLRIAGMPGRAVVTLRAAAHRPNYLPSSVATYWYIFPEHVLTQPITPPGFPANWVSSITTPGDYEMDPQVLNNPRYATLARQALTNLPSVSIVMNVQDLFGAARGVYTRRNDMNQQPASAELIWPDDRAGFQINCGLEIQGGSSTSNSGGDWKSKKLSMRLLFRGDFGADKLEYPLFDNSIARRFDTLILDAGLNMVWNHMTDADQRHRGQHVRDQFMSDLQSHVGGIGPRGRFVHLYLNGLYWGLYDLHERPDASFCAEHFGGRKDEYDVLKHTGTTLVDGNLSAWNTMVARARAGLVDNSRYEALQQYLDVPWFIDYMIINLWAGNTDWAHHNWYAARRRVPGAGFRFISWDAEHVLKSANENRINLNNPGSPTELCTLLRNNAEFRLRFADHVHRHFFNGGAFYVDAHNPIWDSAHPERNVPASLYMKRINEIDPAIVCESARWGDVASSRANNPYTRDAEWLAELNNLLGWATSAGNTANYFPRRSSIVLSQFRGAGLYPAVTAPTYNQHGGRTPRGFKLAMTAPQGTICYTTDGADPREYGTGQLSSTAVRYSSEVTLANSVVVKARALVAGEWSALNEATFQVGELGTPLRFSEIMLNPPGGDAYEFVELANIGRVPVDLHGMEFDGVDFAFPFGTVLPPGEVLVVSSAADPAAFAARYPGRRVAGAFGGNLSNGGERLALRKRNGQTVTSIEYNDRQGWPRAADGLGHSLESLDMAADASDPSNWHASATALGSPGTYSAVQRSPGLWLNEVMAENAGAVANAGTFPDWIELMNDTAAELNVSGYSLTDDAGRPRQFVFPAGARIPTGGFLTIWCDNQTNAPGLHAGFALDRDGDSLVLYDRQTNRLDAVTFGPQVANRSIGRVNTAAWGWSLTLPTPGTANQLAPLAAARNLVINEWHANATASSSDWLELFNGHTTLPAGLRDLYLATANATFQLKALSFVPPGGFVRLWADEQPGPNHLDFKLPAAGGWIELYDEAAAVIDHVSYRAQSEGVSYGRLPDGSATLVQLPAPTPGQPNDATADRDGDGLPDAWETEHGLNTNDPADAKLDADLDGLANEQEFVAGTDPRNAASSLAVAIDRGPNGQVVLRFAAVPGKSYTVQYRDSLTAGSWLKFRDLFAQGNTLTIELAGARETGSIAGYYRLVTPRTP